MSIHEQMQNVYCLEVNQKATLTTNWLHIDSLARVVSRNRQLREKGTVNWLLIGLYPSLEAASEAAKVYREEHASERPPEPSI